MRRPGIYKKRTRDKSRDKVVMRYIYILRDSSAVRDEVPA